MIITTKIIIIIVVIMRAYFNSRLHIDVLVVEVAIHSNQLLHNRLAEWPVKFAI